MEKDFIQQNLQNIKIDESLTWNGHINDIAIKLN